MSHPQTARVGGWASFGQSPKQSRPADPQKEKNQP